MKKCAALCLCLFLCSFAFISHNNVYSQVRFKPGPAYVEDRILVKLKNNAGPFIEENRIANELLQATGASAEALSSHSSSRLHLIHLNGSMPVEDALKRAAGDLRVEYAEPDYFLRATDTIPDDPYFNQMWGLSNPSCPGCIGNPSNDTAI